MVNNKFSQPLSSFNGYNLIVAKCVCMGKRSCAHCTHRLVDRFFRGPLVVTGKKNFEQVKI